MKLKEFFSRIFCTDKHSDDNVHKENSDSDIVHPKIALDENIEESEILEKQNPPCIKLTEVDTNTVPNETLVERENLVSAEKNHAVESKQELCVLSNPVVETEVSDSEILYSNPVIDENVEESDKVESNCPMQNGGQELNAPQMRAVKATEGRIRVVAGAGSGKTRVIAHRYAYLVNELGISPSAILCTTFTNKAAKEMTARISKLVHTGDYNDFVCTIHGFCVKFLRKEIFRIGFPSSFTILDEEDRKTMAKQVMDELEIHTTQKTINDFLYNITYEKNKLNELYVKVRFCPPDCVYDENEKNPFARYLQKQVKLFALDFTDLIWVTVYILNVFPEAKDYWTKKLNYIMVDEAQDLSKTQWIIIEALASCHKNLFIVGDPDQAIYEWRGANPSLFVNFKNDETIILNENYRSTPNILNVANSIIEHNVNRVKKDLFTRKISSTTVVHYHAKSEKQEAEWIVKKIKEGIETGGHALSDFAILYRSTYLSRALEQALIHAEVGYTIWGGFRFFERKEIKDALSYLRLVAADDDLSFMRIINVPSRKLGKAFIAQIKDFAKIDNSSLYQALQKHIGDAALVRYRKSAASFIDLIDSARSLSSDMMISELVNYLVEKSGMKADIRDSGDEDRLDNLNELTSSIKLYEEENAEDDVSLTSYLQDIALYTNADYRKENGTVKLMTIHQSKGLEFPYVFVSGVSEGILPNYHSVRERGQDALEEERRLMYVAITRAEKALFLTESEGYNFSSNSSKYPSRFLMEIKRNWFVTEGDITDEIWKGAKDLQDSFDEEINPDMTGKIQIGQKIIHNTFGEGQVMEINNNGTMVEVKFQNGMRTLNTRFLKSQLLSENVNPDIKD